VPLDPAYKAGLAQHNPVTGSHFSPLIFRLDFREIYGILNMLSLKAAGISSRAQDNHNREDYVA